jgi:hypothetical protein
MQKCFYTPLEQAYCTLEERRSLRGSVEKYWSSRGFTVPAVFSQEPLGFICRHIATGRYEDCVFILMTERAGLRPLWLTYTGDRFVTCSPVKFSYLRPRIVTGFANCSNNPIVKKLKLADPVLVEAARTPLSDIRTENGEPLVEWHRRILSAVYPEAAVIDLSGIFKKCGGAKGYYPLLLSLAVSHGVLFEDFHNGESGESLRGFTEKIFEPSFWEVSRLFGKPPVIVPLPWRREFGYYVGLADWRGHEILKI